MAAMMAIGDAAPLEGRAAGLGKYEQKVRWNHEDQKKISENLGCQGLKGQKPK